MYVVVLGVAVAGLIADRAFFDGGLGPGVAGAAEVSPVTVATPASREPQARLSERVAAAFEEAAQASAALTGEPPDLFDPTDALGPPSAEQSREQTRRAIEADFLRTHKLTALSDHAVVINGTTMLLDRDNEIDGYRLTGIYREGKGVMGAVLVQDDVTIRLPLYPAQAPQPER